MSTRLLRSMTLVVATALLGICGPAAVGDNDESTEDVIHMVDGRVLHGQILNETSNEVVFELVNRAFKLKTRITLSRENITRIQRDVPIEAESPKEKRSTTPHASSSVSTEPQRLYGRAQIDSDNPAVPAVYIIPMKGQMGTDIHGSIYEKVIDDLNEYEPDIIIFVLNSSEYPDLMVPEVEDPRESRGFLMIEEYRDLVNMLKEELPDVRQSVWIKDSVGFCSLLALSWDEVYMAPTARLSGLRRVIDSSGADKWSDPDVRAKMSAAWTGFVKSFLEYGGHGMEIADAMLWPERKLSASFKGREVVWSPTDQGEFVVDADEKNTVEFRAKSAEDLLISNGTVDTLDDLFFLMGYREYRVIDGKGEELVEKYVDQWRKVFEQSKEWYQDYFQHRGWASGEETIKWLGRCKRDLEQIISAMKRYKAVEVRWQSDFGVSRDQLEIEVEKLREEIRALKGTGKRGGGYGNRGGGGMSPGGGG